MNQSEPSHREELRRRDLERLHREGILDGEGFRAALDEWDGTRHWSGFASRWLLVLGGTFLLLGALFFFAYNWAELSRFTRFGLLQGAVLVTATGACFFYHRRGRGEAANLPGGLLLTSAAVLAGILIAVFGQAYQTGADAWLNFIAWAALILPWVAVGRFAPLWVLWLVVLLTGLVLFWQQVMAPIQASGFGTLFVLGGMISFAAFVAREVLVSTRRIDWLDHISLRYLTLGTTLTWFGISAVRLTFADEFRGAPVIDLLGSLFFAAVVAGTIYWFRVRDYDLGSLLAAGLFGPTLLLVVFWRALSSALHVDASVTWLIMALLTLGVYGSAAFVIQKIHQHHHPIATS